MPGAHTEGGQDSSCPPVTPLRHERRNGVHTLAIRRHLHHWHRTVGAFAALFFLFLAVSGILLNHSPDLGLKDRYVSQEKVLDWYGIRPPTVRSSYAVGQHRLTLVGDRLYFDHVELTTGVQSLVGAVAVGAEILVAMEGRMFLLDAHGAVQERFTSLDGIPAGMRALGVAQSGTVLVRAAHGEYQVDLQHLHWQHVAPADVVGSQWSSSTPAGGLAAALQAEQRGRILHWERLLLDLHSGRSFGRFGPLVTDGIAALLILLAVTGLVLWTHSKLCLRHHRHTAPPASMPTATTPPIPLDIGHKITNNET